MNPNGICSTYKRVAWNWITYLEINVQTQNGFIVGPQNAQVQYGIQFSQVEWLKEENRIFINILANSIKEKIKT